MKLVCLVVCPICGFLGRSSQPKTVLLSSSLPATTQYNGFFPCLLENPNPPNLPLRTGTMDLLRPSFLFTDMGTEHHPTFLNTGSFDQGVAIRLQEN